MSNTPIIDNIRLSVSKYTEKTDKSGKRRPVHGTYQARVNGKWMNAAELLKLNYTQFAPFNGTFSMLKLRAGLASFFTTCGLQPNKSIIDSSDAAQKVIDKMTERKEEKEEETVKKGKTAYIENAKEKAGAAFDRLTEKVNDRKKIAGNDETPDGDETANDETEAVKAA